MKTTKMRSSSFTKITTMTLAMLVIGFASTANAHQWTLVVNGKSMKVDAKIIDVNATKVLLENEKGMQKAFAINELNDDDMAYLKDMMVIEQTRIQKAQVAAQREATQLISSLHNNDTWELILYAPNGNYITRQYFARSSLEARDYALRDFPNARIGGARKVRVRRGGRFF